MFIALTSSQTSVVERINVSFIQGYYATRDPWTNLKSTWVIINETSYPVSETIEEIDRMLLECGIFIKGLSNEQTSNRPASTSAKQLDADLGTSDSRYADEESGGDS